MSEGIICYWFRCNKADLFGYYLSMLKSLDLSYIHPCENAVVTWSEDGERVLLSAQEFREMFEQKKQFFVQTWIDNDNDIGVTVCKATQNEYCVEFDICGVSSVDRERIAAFIAGEIKGRKAGIEPQGFIVDHYGVSGEYVYGTFEHYLMCVKANPHTEPLIFRVSDME